ncbi:hypothetical protein ACNTMW_26925 [Planosporangium sp. 12N6]
MALARLSMSTTAPPDRPDRRAVDPGWGVGVARVALRSTPEKR